MGRDADIQSLPASIGRDADIQNVPASMRRDVRLLGDILGQVIAETGGQGLLDDVERLRHAVIAARRGGSSPAAAVDDGAARRADDDIAALVASWPLERADAVARAFTVYFHLANLAEEHYRIRTLRERDTGGERLARRPVGRVTQPQRADALLLFGQVGQVEVHGERAGDLLGPLPRPRGDQRRDRLARRHGLRRSPVRRRTGVDHRVPQPLHVGEQVRPGGLYDHLAEDVAEQPDVPAHLLRQLRGITLPARAGRNARG